MFDNLMNLGDMFKQAQEMSGRMNEIKSQLQNIRVKGSSGGGMVEVEVTGQLMPVSCRIDESLLTPDNRELLEDLPVLENLDAYRQVGDIQFLRTLARERLFDQERTSGDEGKP